MKSESDISKEFSCSENSELEPPELAFKKIMRQSLQVLLIIKQNMFFSRYVISGGIS